MRYIFQHLLHYLDFSSYLTKIKASYKADRESLTIETDTEQPANLYGGTKQN